MTHLLLGLALLPSLLQAAPAAKLHLAVLPFEIKSDKAADKFLAVAIPESVGSTLSQRPDLVLADSGDIAALLEQQKGPVDAAKLGATVGADRVLTGVFERTGDKARITAKLSSVKDPDAGETVAVEKVLASDDELLALADELAAALSPKLAGGKTGKAQAAAAAPAKRTANLEAYKAYAQAKVKFLQFHAKGYSEAEKLFLKALELDGEFTLAKAGLSMNYSYWATRRRQTGKEYKSLYLKARDLAKEALALEPDASEAHLALALASSPSSPKNDEELAAAEARKAVELAPNDFLGYYVLWNQAGALPDDPNILKALELNPRFLAGLSDLGQNLREANRPDEGLVYLKRALAVNPYDSTVHMAVGNAYLVKKEIKPALLHFRKAVKLNPTLSLAHYNLAVGLEAAGLEAEMLASYQKAIELDPKNYGARLNLGVYYMQHGKPDEAIAFLKKAMELDRTKYTAPFNLGLLYTDKEMPDEALTVLRQAAALDQDNPLIAFYIGQNQERKEMFVEAIASYKKAITLRPDYALAYSALGALLIQNPEFRQEGLEYLKSAVEFGPEDQRAHFFYGMALNDIKDREGAIRELKAFMALADAQGPFHQGMLADARKTLLALDPEQAGALVEDMRKGAKANPGDFKTQLKLGISLSKAGLLDEAVVELKKAVAIQPDAFGFAYLANTLQKQEKVDEAAENYRKSLALEGSPNIFMSLGMLYASKDRFGEAAEVFKQGVAANPKDLDTQFFYGMVLKDAGDKKKAAVQLKKYVAAAESDAGQAQQVMEAKMTLDKLAAGL